VAELVDALASGASDRKVVEVQVLSWAPTSTISLCNPSVFQQTGAKVDIMVDKKHPSFTYQKDSIYYFSRVVPHDLRDHYSTARVVVCLRTKSRYRAELASKNIVSKLEDYWLGLRLKKMVVPAQHLLVDPLADQPSSDLPTLLEAQDIYLSTKGVNKNPLFFTHTKRAVGYVVDLLGNKSLDLYTGLDAARFRDKLIDRGLKTSSVRRNITCIKAVVNFTIHELGLNCKNAFSHVYLHEEEKIKNRTIKIEDIRKVQRECLNKQDELRLLIALISDTGMRLSEALGLQVEDLVVEANIPYIELKPNDVRTLKTSTSRRQIPLVGASLEVARHIKNTCSSSYCFPRYISDQCCKANSASAAGNKWLKTISKSIVIHGFRHSFRDRLRAVETPTEVIDQLGGWSITSVGQGYGEGYKLDVLHKYMKLIAL
jgi:integrase